MQTTVERGSDVIARLEWDSILLEYGVPQTNILYALTKVFTEDDVEDIYGEPPEEATSIVEIEASEGRVGAFILRRIESSTAGEIIEVWCWDTSNRKRK